jgi:hypothetical protein
MRKMMMLGVMCFTLLGGQAVLAQSTAPRNQATSLDTSSATGTLDIRYKRRGGRARDWRIRDISNVVLSYNEFDPTNRTWTWHMSGFLGGFYEGPHDSRKRKRTDITYHQPTDRLHIIIDLDRKRLSWNLIKPTKVEVTIAPDKSSFRLDFLGNIETTNHAGRHYNFMKGSWLVATGRLTIPKPRNSSK